MSTDGNGASFCAGPVLVIRSSVVAALTSIHSSATGQTYEGEHSKEAVVGCGRVNRRRLLFGPSECGRRSVRHTEVMRGRHHAVRSSARKQGV